MSTHVLHRETPTIGGYVFTADELESARPHEEEIAAYEQRDARDGLQPGAVVFLGSSSIRIWPNIARHFADVLPGIPLLNRGFGGSEASDSLFYADRVLLPHRPRAVVFYAGDNDLVRGKSPERIAAGERALCQHVWQSLPNTKLFLISVKPSVAHWDLLEAQNETNRLLLEFCQSDERLTYVDIVKPMLGAHRQVQPELYVADGSHLSLAGYRVWREVLTGHLATLI